MRFSGNVNCLVARCRELGPFRFFIIAESLIVRLSRAFSLYFKWHWMYPLAKWNFSIIRLKYVRKIFFDRSSIFFFYSITRGSFDEKSLANGAQYTYFLYPYIREIKFSFNTTEIRKKNLFRSSIFFLFLFDNEGVI